MYASLTVCSGTAGLKKIGGGGALLFGTNALMCQVDEDNDTETDQTGR